MTFVLAMGILISYRLLYVLLYPFLLLSLSSLSFIPVCSQELCNLSQGYKFFIRQFCSVCFFDRCCLLHLILQLNGNSAVAHDSLECSFSSFLLIRKHTSDHALEHLIRHSWAVRSCGRSTTITSLLALSKNRISSSCNHCVFTVDNHNFFSEQGFFCHNGCKSSCDEIGCVDDHGCAFCFSFVLFLYNRLFSFFNFFKQGFVHFVPWDSFPSILQYLNTVLLLS